MLEDMPAQEVEAHRTIERALSGDPRVIQDFVEVRSGSPYLKYKLGHPLTEPTGADMDSWICMVKLPLAKDISRGRFDDVVLVTGTITYGSDGSITLSRNGHDEGCASVEAAVAALLKGPYETLGLPPRPDAEDALI